MEKSRKNPSESFVQLGSTQKERQICRPWVCGGVRNILHPLLHPRERLYIRGRVLRVLPHTGAGPDPYKGTKTRSGAKQALLSTSQPLAVYKKKGEALWLRSQAQSRVSLSISSPACRGITGPGIPNQRGAYNSAFLSPQSLPVGYQKEANSSLLSQIQTEVRNLQSSDQRSQNQTLL